MSRPGTAKPVRWAAAMAAFLLVGAAPATSPAQFKKEGISYKALLQDGGRVVGMRTGSIIIQKDNVLYNCPLQTLRKSLIRYCKELRAEGERKN